MVSVLRLLSLAVFLICGLQSQAQKKFEVIAYYDGNGDNIENYELNKITQIIYSFTHLKGDTIHFPSEKKKEGLKKLVGLKKTYPQLKILVSLGGWGGCEPCSPVFAKAESRKNFAASVAKMMKETGCDGIDLDWEYPSIPGHPGHPYSLEDKPNFTDLIIQLRKAMGPQGELSFAAGGFTKFLEESVDWKAIMPYLNRVNLMTYDLVHGYSTQTGHHTGLMSIPGQKESTDNCVQWLLKHGVDPDKLVIGAAFYGRIWEEVSSTNNGLVQSGKFKRGVNYTEFDLLEPDSGWVHHWDPVALAPYAYNKSKKWYATYDNSESVKAKVEYARRYKLGGIMFWELTCDKPKNGLLAAMDEAVKKTAGK